jgi:hypothetical protein
MVYAFYRTNDQPVEKVAARESRRNDARDFFANIARSESPNDFRPATTDGNRTSQRDMIQAPDHLERRAAVGRPNALVRPSGH